MRVSRTVRRFLSSWIAFILVLSPVLLFLSSFLPGMSDRAEFVLQVAVSLLFAFAFLRSEYSLGFLWSFVYTLWSGYLIYLFVLLAFIFGVSLVFDITPAPPSELGFGYQVIIVVLSSIVFFQLYRSAYRKTNAEKA